MGFWEWLLFAVLSWFFLGLIATVIPHRSARLRARLIIMSRRSLERGMKQYAKRRGESEVAVRRRYGLADTDEAHLRRVYRGLVLSGPYAYWMLWRAHRVKLPDDSSPPG